MRKCKVRLGRLVLIDIEGKSAQAYAPANEHWRYVAGAEADADGRLVHLYYEPCNAEAIAKALKDDPVTEEELSIEVWALDGKTEKERLYAFDGTLYDALLIAANEGKQYDV